MDSSPAPEDNIPLYPTGGALAYRSAPSASPDEISLAFPSKRTPPRATAAVTPGDDSYDRTLCASPGRSFQKVLARAFDAHHAGRSVRVVLTPGIYRESFAAAPSTSSSRFLIEAREPGRTILRGSDIWSRWQRDGGLWQAPWPHRWGLGGAPDSHGDPNLLTPDLMRRREMVFVDGGLQRQVLQRADLVPGTFFVDEDIAKILLQPTVGIDPCKALVEVGARTGLLEINGRRNVTLRGLGFEHDAPPFFTPQRAALQLHNCRNVLVEHCDLRWNNVKGLQITGGETDGVTLRKVTANRNGCLGILAARARNLRLEDCETSFNNWRGAWAGKYRGSPCGVKILRGVGVTLLRHRAVRNLATGIWIDEDNRDVHILQSVIHGNYRGLHLEAGGGPILVEGCTITSNRQEPSGSAFRWTFGSGIALTHATDVTLRGNFVTDNDVAQIGVRDDRETRTLTDPETNEKNVWRTERMTLADNLIVATGPQQALLQLPGETFDGGRCLRSFRADANTYVGAADQPGFRLGSFHATGPRRALDLPAWQALTGQDTTSTHESS